MRNKLHTISENNVNRKSGANPITNIYMRSQNPMPTLKKSSGSSKALFLCIFNLKCLNHFYFTQSLIAKTKVV